MRWHDFFGFAAPSLCAGCGRALVAGERSICARCELDFERHAVAEDFIGPLRARILPRTAPIDAVFCWSAYTHDNAFGAVLRRAKYADRPTLMADLGAIMGARIAGHPLAAATDVLLPVPMHWLKRLRRGYNQTEILAHALGKALGVPVGDNLVARRRHVSQTRLSADERRRALGSSFALRHPGELTGLRVGIVDDIITTGGTLSAAVETLMQARPASVTVFVLAATPRE